MSEYGPDDFCQRCGALLSTVYCCTCTYVDRGGYTRSLEVEYERMRKSAAADILVLREALAEAIQSLEEWGAAEELAVGIARWRVVLGGGNDGR